MTAIALTIAVSVALTIVGALLPRFGERRCEENRQCGEGSQLLHACSPALGAVRSPLARHRNDRASERLHPPAQRPARLRISGWMRVPKFSTPSRKSSKVSSTPPVFGTAAISSSMRATLA